MAQLQHMQISMLPSMVLMNLQFQEFLIHIQLLHSQWDHHSFLLIHIKAMNTHLLQDMVISQPLQSQLPLHTHRLIHTKDPHLQLSQSICKLVQNKDSLDSEFKAV